MNRQAQPMRVRPYGQYCRSETSALRVSDYSSRVSSPSVGDVVAALDALYPPQTAEDWDVVGLTCGDRSTPARKVIFAIDPLPVVVDEALAWGADLLVTHHPLLLRPTHSVATDDWKGVFAAPADPRRLRPLHRPHQC